MEKQYAVKQAVEIRDPNGFRRAVMFFYNDGTLDKISIENTEVSRALYEAMTDVVLDMAQDKVALAKKKAEEAAKAEAERLAKLPTKPHIDAPLQGLFHECLACGHHQTFVCDLVKWPDGKFGDGEPAEWEMQTCKAEDGFYAHVSRIKDNLYRAFAALGFKDTHAYAKRTYEDQLKKAED